MTVFLKQILTQVILVVLFVGSFSLMYRENKLLTTEAEVAANHAADATEAVYTESVNGLLTLLISLSEEPMYGPEPDALNNLLVSLKQHPGVIYAYFIDPDFNVLADGSEDNPLSGEVVPEERKMDLDINTRQLVAQGEELLFTAPITSQGEVLGYLQVVMSLELVHDIAGQLGIKILSNQEASEKRSFVIMAGSLVVMIIALIVAVLVFLRVRNALLAMADAMSNIGGKTDQLGGQLDESGKDELSAVGRSFNKLMNEINRMLGHIKATTIELADISDNVAHQSSNIKGVIGEQRESTQTVVSAITRLHESVDLIAVDTAKASTLAEDSKVSVTTGAKTINLVTESISHLSADLNMGSEAMHRLEKHSGEISGLLDSIRGIADQTNLLALNAAIEAARAGERGKGFAVVADEVRALASRTQDSTQLVEGVVANFQTGVASAVGVIEKGSRATTLIAEKSVAASAIFEDILNVMKIMHTTSIHIAEATQGQTDVVKGIDDAVKSMSDQADQSWHSAESIEETGQGLKAASNKLDSQLDSLG